MTKIYFIRRGQYIKIGYSWNVAERLKQLASHYVEELELLGTIQGARAQEHAIHEKLKEHRVKGEWFNDCDAVRSFMSAAIAEENSRAPAEQAKNATPNWAQLFGRVSSLRSSIATVAEQADAAFERVVPGSYDAVTICDKAYALAGKADVMLRLAIIDADNSIKPADNFHISASFALDDIEARAFGFLISARAKLMNAAMAA